MIDTYSDGEERGNTAHDKDEVLFGEENITDLEGTPEIIIQDVYDIEEEAFCESLKQQVQLELEQLQEEVELKEAKHTGRWKRFLILSGVFLGVLLLCAIWMVGTRSGRRMIYKIAGGFVSDHVDKDEPVIVEVLPVNDTSNSNSTSLTETRNSSIDSTEVIPVPRKEEYVRNYLIFGVEEIENAKNTDTMMLVSVNTKDKKIRLTSLLRDTYVETADGEPAKLNSIYATDGAYSLIEIIEQNYLIEIDGYAYINFSSFEAIIDYLGGISIELGEEEANYLNTTNYISNRENRKVTQGWNTLNGNQALGYCRIRKCVTLGGANDDYGRTLRQRRTLEAIFNRYKSNNILDLLFMMDNILGYVKTNLTSDQIGKLMEAIVENKITTMDTFRVPVNGAFEALDEYNGIGDPLVIDWESNRKELYQFIFGNTE